jgi:hypothetical protein
MILTIQHRDLGWWLNIYFTENEYLFITIYLAIRKILFPSFEKKHFLFSGGLPSPDWLAFISVKENKGVSTWKPISLLTTGGLKMNKSTTLRPGPSVSTAPAGLHWTLSFIYLVAIRTGRPM